MIKTNEIFRIEDSMYNWNIWFWYGDKGQFTFWAKNEFSIPMNECEKWFESGMDCMFIPLMNNKDMMLFVSNNSGGTENDILAALAHEIHHASFHALQIRGVEYSKSSEEAFCYWASWLFLTLLNVFPKESKKHVKKNRS
jgi:hypothetical protein